MQLKLAEYSTDGKFRRFLELGKDFAYGGEFILVDGKFNKPHEKWLSCPTCLRSYGFASAITLQEFEFKKDEKDPLNRFNGRFNGLTYGKGRFILIEEDSDDFNRDRILKSDWMAAVYFGQRNYEDFIAVGNIHENPEFYSKL
jgi:hypothetical protein